MNASATKTPAINVGAFVRLTGSHDRSGECGKVIASRNDGTARFAFHFDQFEIEVAVADLSTDTLVYWGL